MSNNNGEDPTSPPPTGDTGDTGDISETSPVTVGMLRKVLEEMSGQFEKRFQEQEMNTVNRLNSFGVEIQNSLKVLVEQINGRLTEFAGQYRPQENFSQGPQQSQVLQPVPPQQGIAEQRGQLMELLQPYIDRYLQKYLGEETPSADPAVYEFKKNTEMLNKLIYRKAALTTGKMFDKVMRTMLKEGDLIDQEAAALVQGSLNTDSPPLDETNHGPI